jgi:hypothetical protein
LSSISLLHRAAALLVDLFLAARGLPILLAHAFLLLPETGEGACIGAFATNCFKRATRLG